MIDKILIKAKAVFSNRIFMIVLSAVALLSSAFSAGKVAFVVFALLIDVILIADDNLVNLILPVLLMTVMMYRCPSEQQNISSYLWLLIPIVLSAAFHIIYYRKSFVFSRNLYGLSAVSVALILGGLGSIGKADYFSSGSLYHIFFLGMGMIGFYLLFRNYIREDEKYDLIDRVMEILLIVGIYAAVFLLYERFFVERGRLSSTWKNDLGDFIMMSLPASFYFARKNIFFLAVTFCLFETLFISESLSAVVCACAVCFGGMFYLFNFRQKGKKLSVLILLGTIITGIVFVYCQNNDLFKNFGDFLSKESSGRGLLIEKAWNNYISHPVFGVGIGYMQGGDNGISIGWVHNYLFQILQSMGTVGLIAYSYNIFVRAKTVFRVIDCKSMALGMIYASILLVSMFQPGEFCPFPYEFTVVLLISVSEIYVNKAEREIKELSSGKETDKRETDSISTDLL